VSRVRIDTAGGTASPLTVCSGFTRFGITKRNESTNTVEEGDEGSTSAAPLPSDHLEQRCAPT
jgi:hypothetical protein